MPGFGKRMPPSPNSALPPAVIAARSPSSDFGENKLSPSSFGISPLTTTPPNGLQSTWVRASRPCHRTFTLVMVSSPGFVSNRRHWYALFTLAFAAPAGVAPFGSPRRLTRWLMLQKARRQRIAPPPTVCRHTVSESISLPSPGFFSPFPHGTVALSVIQCI